MSTAPFIDGDPQSPGGAWLVAYNDAGQRQYIACILADPKGIDDPVAALEGRLLDMDPDVDTLTSRLVAAFEADPRHWPAGTRLWEISADAIRFDYQARKAMAEAIHQADKGTGLDASPPWMRDRYLILAEAALRHAAGQVGVAVIEPVHAGIHRVHRTIAVGCPDDPRAPRGYDPLFRVVYPDEPTPTGD